MTNDIDFVVPWVDGDDPAWQIEKKKYESGLVFGSEEVNSINRYRDWGLLKYWFRGVEKYAPWVRKIHFITWGHLPSFLKMNHPKLQIVYHRDFIPDDCLPLFNSSAIEVSLHKIKGLSEKFVYFNDDMFLLNSVSERDFFKNDMPCCYFEENPFYLPGNSNYEMQVYNALVVVNKHFDKHLQMKKNLGKWFSQTLFSKPFFYTLLSSPWNRFLGFPTTHLPAAFIKDTWEKVWRQEPDLLNFTMHSRFRKCENVQQELFRFWQLAEGTFFPQRLIGRYFPLTDDTLSEICVFVEKQLSKEICINDVFVSNFENARSMLAKSFEKILPEKSSFEN